MTVSTREPAGIAVVLETKFYIPNWRPGLVTRPRLLERLDRGRNAKLTLVSAPAGFGKTTMLAEWLAAAHADERSAAWLSLDPSDNRAASFWTYVITALQTLKPELGTDALALLQARQAPPIETLLVDLLNEIGALSHDVVLVLDDYHVIETPAIHDGIAFLLDHLPSQLHLVIVSRADPPLALARMRTRGELVEVRAADLRFSADEAAAFLSDAMGLDLAPQDVAALEARTEGWIAGLQLAALSMQGRDDVPGFIAAFAGDDRYIVDYLVEEVLQHQPEDVRAFLLRTSILQRLSGPLCDAVTGDAGGRAMLERLERGNLFVVPLDDRRQWYRYHHLFADVLEAHLREEQLGQLRDLHGRASIWFEQDAQPADAIRHALAADDAARAAGLVELQAQAIVRAHQPDRLIEWVKAIPDDVLRSMPVLSTYYAFALQGIGEIEASESHLSNAARWLDDPAAAIEGSTASGAMLVVDEAAFQSLRSRIAIGRGYVAISAGDVAGTVEYARQALDLLPEDEHHWLGTAGALLALAHWADGNLLAAHKVERAPVANLERAGDVVLALNVAYHEGDLLKARGRLSEAGRMYERSLRLAARRGAAAIPGVANLHFGLTDLCCEQDDLVRAAEPLRQGEELGDFAALPATPYRRHLARARLRHAHGDLDGAVAELDEAQRVYVRGAVPDVRPVAVWKMRVRLAQGKLDEALAWTRTQVLSTDDEPSYLREFHHLTLARVLIAQSLREQDIQRAREVDQLLERLREAAETRGRMGAVVEILMLRGIAQRALGDIPAGLVHLKRALALAEPEGYVRLFVDEGEPMRDLLRHAISAGIGGVYASRLLAAFKNDLRPAAASIAVGALAEPLTAREVEILRLIAGGMRNQEIADHLVISVSTVKRHIANGYGKLGVGHRTEAVARANELSLL